MISGHSTFFLQDYAVEGDGEPPTKSAKSDFGSGMADSAREPNAAIPKKDYEIFKVAGICFLFALAVIAVITCIIVVISVQ